MVKNLTYKTYVNKTRKNIHLNDWSSAACNYLKYHYKGQPRCKNMPIHIFKLIRFNIPWCISVVKVSAKLRMIGNEGALVGLKVIGVKVGKCEVCVAVQSPILAVDMSIDKFGYELRGKRNNQGL